VGGGADGGGADGGGADGGGADGGGADGGGAADATGGGGDGSGGRAHDLLVFPDRDAASEWIEERLLARHGGAGLGRTACALDEHRLMRGLTPEQLARLAPLLRPRAFTTGERLAALGDDATEVYLLMRGELSSSLPLPGGGRRRLSTLTPGWTVGEVAVLGEAARTADTYADTDGDLLVLSAEDFHALAGTEPALHATLLRNMLSSAYEVAAQLMRELGRPGLAGE
jgi:hypothetical protein